MAVIVVPVLDDVTGLFVEFTIEFALTPQTH